jgi:putative oxidoreductase
MSILHTAARTMLASMFVYGGLDSVRNPGPKVPAAEPVTEPLSQAIPQLPDDTEQLVRINGAVQVGAGLMLATGRLRRPAALALAGTLLPTTAAGHAFWRAQDGATRQQQTIHFLKNVSMLGGLLLAAMDTEGEPGVAWRAQHAVEHANILADHKREVAGLQAELAKERARAATAATRAKVGATTRQARRDAKVAAKVGRSAAKAATSAGRTAKRAVAAAIPG